MNMEKEKRNFENHKATLTDYGNIIILDFKIPNLQIMQSDFYLKKISANCTYPVIWANW